MELTYELIRLLFVLWKSYYNTREVHGLEHVPHPGTPCIVVFNHGNGLVDPALLIAHTPRLLKFLAKDTLWNMMFVGTMVRSSGAIPVYRPRDHGVRAQEFNVEMFRAAFAALHKGDCLAIAPEGVSRFAPGMAQPMKTGVARIALQAVDSKRDCRVHLLPVGLTYTHREKFRSDVCLQYGPCIVVDASRLPGDDVPAGEAREKALFARAQGLTEEINQALLALTLHAEDFASLRRALTATRLLLPLGTRLSLKAYISVLRCWVASLRPGDVQVALDEYQTAIEAVRVKDDRLRRFAFAEPAFGPVAGMLRHLALAAGLGLVALPGLAAWTPVWAVIRMRERALLSRGPGWNDSIAEMKVQLSSLVMLVASLALLRRPKRLVLLWAWFVLTIRAYEEAVASLRSFYSHRRLYQLSPESIQHLLKLRRAAVDRARGFAQAHFPHILQLHPEDMRDDATVVRHPFWGALLGLQRKKRDWNEILRTEDHNTFDYVQ